jgi:CBS domain containing-hemolysin-like protein
MSQLIIIFLTVVFSALFSGLEMAFLASNKLHIELQNKKGVFPYSVVSFLVNKPSRFIATLLVGNNIALVIYGHYMHQVLEPAFEFGTSEYLALLLETICSTMLLLFVAEYIPKALFRAHSDQMMHVFAVPAYIIYFVLYIPVSLMIGVSNLIIKYVFRVNVPNFQPVFGRIELDNYVRERMPDKNDDEDTMDTEVEIFKNALQFSTQKAREFMIPRTEIEAVDVNSDLGELRQIFIKSGYSKILIYKENIDEIIGYVHAFELFKKPESIRSILRPVSFIPESMTANQILNSFTKLQRNVAVVIDEFGGTAGMITLEDVVEELFGEIEDEHDTDEFTENQISEKEYVFSARLEVDYINDEYNLSLPESENYSTLSGLIYQVHESIPDKGEVIEIDDFIFTIREVSDNRIEEVHLRVK